MVNLTKQMTDDQPQDVEQNKEIISVVDATTSSSHAGIASKLVYLTGKSPRWGRKSP